MAKEAYYFSHDSNARNDHKICALRSKFGWEGYGLFWALVEIMREEENNCINVSNNAILNAIAFQLHCKPEHLQSVLDACLEIGLFEADKNGFLYSPRLRRSMNMMNAKREQAKKNAEKRWNKNKPKNATAKQKESESNANPMQGKEKKGKEIEKEKKGKVKGKTLPPSAEDFTFNEATLKRISEKGLSEEDARKHLHDCLDYYQGHGKMMKDWQATYRNWIGKDWIKPSKTKQGFKTDWDNVG